MTLYSAILNNIRDDIYNTFKEAAKRDRLLENMLMNDELFDNSLNCEFAKSRFLIDRVYDLNGQEISDDVLDDLVKDIEKIERLYHKHTLTDSRILPVRKNYFKAYIEFYQQVIQQEGNAYSLVGAIRMQFKTKEAFKKALESIIQIQEKEHDILSKLQPVFAKPSQALIEASRIIADKRTNEIFPEG